MEPVFLAGIFCVAFLYASVGHGGASGYLAMIALAGLAVSGFKAGALTLNLLVAALSFFAFRQAKHFEWKLFWPFAVASIPCSFLGGLLAVPPHLYAGLLAATLAWTAWRLAIPRPVPTAESYTRPPVFAAMGTGAGIGLLSGMVGVGGGIFLSPLMILMGWAETKQVAAVSALFIWVNSAAGLLGHFVRGGTMPVMELGLVGSAFAGGALGSQLGARKFDSPTLKRLLAVVLALAAYKLGGMALR